MPSIDELMTGKQPGKIRITTLGCGEGFWFRPYFKVEDHWYGLSNYGRANSYLGTSKGWSWELCQDPTCCEDCEKLRRERDEIQAALDMFVLSALTRTGR